MHRNQFLVLLFLGAFILSCEEDETDLIAYPSLYHKSGVEAGNLKVFSSQGEIKIKTIINRFTQYDTSYYNYYINSIRHNRGILDTVEFVDEKYARLNHQYRNLDCLLNTENDLLILTETEATRVCCTLGEVVTRTLSYKMGKVKPEVHSEFLYSSTSGYYRFGYTGRNKFVLKKSSGSVVAPVIQFRVYSSNAGNSGFMNNILLPDFYKNLAVGDTLTIMESLILFEK